MVEEIFRGVARRRDHDGREGRGGNGDRVGLSRLRGFGRGEEPDHADLGVNDGAWASARVHWRLMDGKCEG